MMNNDGINEELDADTIKKLNSNYTTVPASSINLPHEEDFVKDTNFSETSEAFWSQYEGGKFYRKYDTGVMNGTFNDRRPTYVAITSTFLESLKSSIRLECEKDDKTTEELVELFKLLDHSMNMMNIELEKHLSHRPDGISLMAHLHGVFNAFVEQNIKKGN